MKPLDLLKHHVTGAIDRGEAQAIESKTLQSEFAKIKKEAKSLAKLQDQAFWDRQDVLKKMLQDFFYNFKSSNGVTFIDLSKSDFLLLCELVSSLRPIEPHSFLTRIAMCLDEKRILK
jgi:hypothetical protein